MATAFQSISIRGLNHNMVIPIPQNTMNKNVDFIKSDSFMIHPHQSIYDPKPFPAIKTPLI